MLRELSRTTEEEEIVNFPIEGRNHSYILRTFLICCKRKKRNRITVAKSKTLYQIATLYRIGTNMHHEVSQFVETNLSVP
jgi:hypothetical protein